MHMSRRTSRLHGGPTWTNHPTGGVAPKQQPPHGSQLVCVYLYVYVLLLAWSCMVWLLCRVSFCVVFCDVECGVLIMCWHAASTDGMHHISRKHPN
jgi:hypothetical protein